jgi:hypothetical protein
VLSAENSTVVSKKDEHGRSTLPQGAQPGPIAIYIWQCYSCQLAAE